MSIERPEEVKQCPSNKDCLILSDWPAYRGQLVRLAACEKNLNWEHFRVDFVGKLAQVEPWYVKMNENAYVPTMLTPDGNVLAESSKIV